MTQAANNQHPLLKLGPGGDYVKEVWAPDPLRDVCEAVLLFHSGEPWTYAQESRWFELTQRHEATTKVLCDFLRETLAKRGGGA